MKCVLLIHRAGPQPHVTVGKMAPDMSRNRLFWSWRVDSTDTKLLLERGHTHLSGSSNRTGGMWGFPSPSQIHREFSSRTGSQREVPWHCPLHAPKVGLCVGWACGLCPNPRKKDLIRQPLLEAPGMTSPQHHLGAKKTRARPPRRTFRGEKSQTSDPLGKLTWCCVYC